MHISAWIAAACLSVYWLAVVVKLVLLGRELGKDPNAIPRTTIGRLLRIIWLPTVLAWIGLLWLAARDRFWHFHHLRRYLLTLPVNESTWVSSLAATIIILATVATFWCWRQMGTSWRIGIDPKETTELVVSGPFAYVRHPIYGLSVILAIASWFIVPNALMLIVASVHSCLLLVEASCEEGYLIKRHGQRYQNYCQNVGRFFPNSW